MSRRDPWDRDSSNRDSANRDSSDRDSSDRESPASDSLPELLDSLETTLRALRDELGPEGGGLSPRGPSDRRFPPRPPGAPRLPRPPRMREILRFTDEYTIPTLVAVLEANVRLLRMVQAGIRAVDPERSVFDDRSTEGAFAGELRRVAGDAGRVSADRLASSLSELQRALSESELPENPEARDLLADARSLSDEVERRIRESREQTDLSRFDERGDSTRSASPRWGRRSGRRGADRDAAPVRIEVRDDDEASGEAPTDETPTGEAEREPDVDVDAELESIKDEMGRNEADEEAADAGEDDAGDEDGEDPGAD